MVVISLLNLPIELPAHSRAAKAGLKTFLDGLPEYISACR